MEAVIEIKDLSQDHNQQLITISRLALEPTSQTRLIRAIRFRYNFRDMSNPDTTLPALTTAQAPSI